MNAKPPPHMIEMALASLRNRALPPKPVDSDVTALSRGFENNGSNRTGKRRRATEDDDSSDDDGDARGGGGYSSQFRMRQRARQEAAVGIS